MWSNIDHNDGRQEERKQKKETASSDESLSSDSESESEEDYSMHTLRKDQAKDMKTWESLLRP